MIIIIIINSSNIYLFKITIFFLIEIKRFYVFINRDIIFQKYLSKKDFKCRVFNRNLQKILR